MLSFTRAGAQVLVTASVQILLDARSRARFLHAPPSPSATTTHAAQVPCAVAAGGTARRGGLTLFQRVLGQGQRAALEGRAQGAPEGGSAGGKLGCKLE